MSSSSGAARRRKKKEREAEGELFFLGNEDANRDAEANLDLGTLAKDEKPVPLVDAGDTGAKSSDYGTVGSPTDTGSEGQAYGLPAVLKPQPKAEITKRLRLEKEAKEKGVVIE